MSISVLVETGPRWILGRTFRLNPEYRLVRHGDLDGDERRTFESLARSPQHFGVLVPPPLSGLGIQAVDRDAARLIEHLSMANELPAELRERGGPGANRRIALLVMDGILEIDCDNRFVSGVHAHEELLERALETAEPAGLVARLSDEALRHAEILPIKEPDRMTQWLYAYGTSPLDPSRARALASWSDIEQFAGISAATRTGRLLREHYAGSAVPGWMAWQRMEKQLRHLDADGSSTAFKLYVSPEPDVLAEIMPVLVECLVASNVAAFKMGRDAHGVLRPDKIVVYFDDLATLHALVAVLAPRIAGFPAQGVPFTAAMDEDGLLSWGIDPPRNSRLPGWRGSESWRVWITERLARALLRARATSGDQPEPRLVAMDRIRAEGIDPVGWLPPNSLWQEEDQ